MNGETLILIPAMLNIEKGIPFFVKVVVKSASGNWEQLLDDMKSDDENADDVSGVAGDGADIMLV